MWLIGSRQILGRNSQRACGSLEGISISAQIESVDELSVLSYGMPDTGVIIMVSQWIRIEIVRREKNLGDRSG